VNDVHYVNVIHETAIDRPARRREARVEGILDAAMALLDREGIEALTLQRLGKELDVVPAALYRYFASKDALLAAMQRRTVAMVHERLRTYVAELSSRTVRVNEGTRALSLLLGLSHFYAEANEAMPQAFHLVQALLGDPRPLIADEDARATTPLLGALLGDVAALFREAVRLAVLPEGDAAERTLILWATLQGIVSLRKIARFEPRCSDTIGLSESAVLLSGWGADPDEIRRARRTLQRASSAP
jgi:AcrR family transcriptional regulator